MNIGKILDAPKESGSAAIHLGYKFLAKNLLLGEACDKRNIKLIGPEATVIDAMRSKITARKLMKKARVSVISGTEHIHNGCG